MQPLARAPGSSVAARDTLPVTGAMVNGILEVIRRGDSASSIKSVVSMCSKYERMFCLGTRIVEEGKYLCERYEHGTVVKPIKMLHLLAAVFTPE